jgi:hypothetical protein
MAIPSPNTVPINIALIGLKNSFSETDLDLENPQVLGGPINDYKTEYPESSTGTPTGLSNPGQPRRFIHKYTPKSTYLSKIIGNSNFVKIPDPTEEVPSTYPLKLGSSLNKTNLDVENPGVLGGPNKDITTIYPSTTTGVPTTTDYPSGPTTKFSQPYTPNKTYLSFINDKIIENSKLSNDSINPEILAITSLDVENPGVLGGPNKDITTVYPPEATGTPNLTQNPGGPAQNFDPQYAPLKTYLSFINDKIIENSKLSNNSTNPEILAITNLDNTEEGVNGGYPYINIIDPTIYPPTAQSVSPTTFGFSNIVGKVAKKLNSQYNINTTYLQQTII